MNQFFWYFRFDEPKPRSFANPDSYRDQSRPYSKASSLTIDAPWFEPTQKVTGVVELSTCTRRMLVGRGSRYVTAAPLRVSSRVTWSLSIEPVQASPFLSSATS